MQIILSSYLKVEILKATIITVNGEVSLYAVIASSILVTLAWSIADVASSRIKIFGFLTRALATANYCSCPPENEFSWSPTTVMSFLSLSSISQAPTDSRHYCISNSVAFGLAYCIFSLIVVLKMNGLSETYPTFYLISFLSKSSTFFPSIKISPPVGLYSCIRT